ncbi:HD domain-containing protein [bacterium]|nr:HD domain-containing protein [bacterium]
MFSTDITYDVVTFSIGDTKAGTKMGKLQLKDPEDSSLLNCILWEETLNRMDSKVFRSGNKLRIVSGSFNEKYNNCLVSAIELVEEAMTGLTDEQTKYYYEGIFSYIEKIKDEKKKEFLKEYFNEYEEKIKIAPAAKLMHHNFIGGLLVHTYECCQFAENFVNNAFQKINTDDLYTACILHDIGKIFEYTVDTESGLIDYNEEFKKDWITHSQYGYSLCMSQGFKQAARMIAAHHGRTEWGAIIDLNEKDLESSVYIVHHIDDLSAKFGRINVAMLK